MGGPPKLRRIITLPLLTFYGIGTILGAGVYVLIGKIAGIAGIYAPYAFLMATIIATFVALSYSELASRFPKSAGEANYVHQAFHKRWITLFTGIAIMLTGAVSAAVMARGFHGYLSEFVRIPIPIAIIGFVSIITIIAIWGVLESAKIAAIVTFIELSGILLVLWVAKSDLGHYAMNLGEYSPPMEGQAWAPIFLSAFIAFYAYIGFEDMVNIAEEVVEPERNMPRAIIVALIVTTLIYMLVAAACVAALPIDVLRNSEAPFADILRAKSQIPPSIISAISIVAILNGALVQIIMGSRVLYGLAEQGDAPKIFAQIWPKTQTPLIASLLFGLFVAALALWLPLETLAKTTSFIILIVFAVVCSSLLVVKKNAAPHNGLTLHPAIPLLAALLCLSFIAIQIWL